jgi:hypothetical protein
MLPSDVKCVLWSYDTEKINLESDKKLIISQVLNFGNFNATNWMFDLYGKKTVREIALSISKGQWNNKSLSFWSLVLNFDMNNVKSRFE